MQSVTGPGAVGCSLTLAVNAPSRMVLQVAAGYRPGVLIQDRLDVISTAAVPASTAVIVGSDHGRQHLVQAEPGLLTVTYAATVARTAPATPELVTDEQRVIALRPSRYCPSDRMTGFAWSHFDDPNPLGRVRMICAYVWRRIAYEASISGPNSDAVDTLLAGRGVCRDFAHLVVALCRAVEVPARVAAVYAPGLSPMDFHAVVETAIDGVWWAWDATRLAPRQSLVRIATGRDAADIAFLTVLSGLVELSTVEMTAIAPTDLAHDNHEQLIALA